MSGKVREIAQRAGVSIATVSRVIHGSESVRVDTYNRVLQVMEEMDVKPSDLVRNVKKREGIIGVLVPDLSNSFFAELIAGIEAVAQQEGYGLFICHTKEDENVELRHLQLLRKVGISGILITAVSDNYDNFNNEYLNLLRSMKVPVVLLDRDVKYSNFDGVFVDNERGAFDITRVLLDSGHQNIALIGGPLNTKPGREREEGFRNAFRYRKLPVAEDLICRGDFSLEYGKTTARRLLESSNRPTAIFCANNMMTIGCVSAIQELGLRIPEDIAVVAFDDVSVLNDLGFPLTAVSRPSSQMGSKAMKMLCKALDSHQAEVVQRIIMPPRVILRGSEKRLPGQDQPIPGQRTGEEGRN